MTTNTDSYKDSTNLTDKRPVVIGLYGVSGCGKTHLMNQLKEHCAPLPGFDKLVSFRYYDGSEVIEKVSGGNLEKFKNSSEDEKRRFRELAIERIRNECAESNACGLVAGHYMFWDNEEDTEGQEVCTEKDLEIYTHIIYLDVFPAVIDKRRRGDSSRKRQTVSVEHLEKWQNAERTRLRQRCREHGILFLTLYHSDDATMLQKAECLRDDFATHTESGNLCLAKLRATELIFLAQNEMETMLVFDADRTLCVEDTGRSFWEKLSRSMQLKPDDEGYPLKNLFGGPLGYSYTAFRQAALLYEEYTNADEFERLCHEVASEVTMRPEFVSLLKSAVKRKHVGVMVVTSGLRRVWEYVLENEGLYNLDKYDCVRVIGGGRLLESVEGGMGNKETIVTADVKAKLVAHLKSRHSMYVWAFGDSPLDLKMLHEADRAIVVVGEENNRSKTMDAALAAEIKKGLTAHQALMPLSNTSSRLDTNTLPLIQLSHEDAFKSILGYSGFSVFHATESSTGQLLMTPTRNAEVAGTALREAHHRVGMYLAVEFLTRSEVIGLEEFEIPHVQGHTVEGFRLLNEKQTAIIPLMRGGEPMAFGINDAFPLAMFIHAKEPTDLKPQNLQGLKTIILVDSVVNTGKSLVQYVKHVRNQCPEMRIVFVAGVIQVKAFSSIRESLGPNEELSLVTLRISQNKFPGQGTTDTGNRLFNTTHLD